jgi:prepilin-type N-terminal cleavage/methylation domain-containing protein
MEIMNQTPNVEGRRAFTVIELLIVILIIGILIGFSFPVFQGVLDRAKKVQAKNDLTQIVTAVNAYYTEYGKYPLPAGTVADTIYGPGGTLTNDVLFDVLRNNTDPSGPNLATVTSLNPRQIVFVQPSVVRNTSRPMLGVVPNGSTGAGIWYDPWGSPYNVAIDGNYNNVVRAPSYTDLATTYTRSTDGSDVGVTAGVIAWAFGKNGILGGGASTNSAPPNATEGGSNGVFSGSGDVISWQ